MFIYYLLEKTWGTKAERLVTEFAAATEREAFSDAGLACDILRASQYARIGRPKKQWTVSPTPPAGCKVTKVRLKTSVREEFNKLSGK